MMSISMQAISGVATFALYASLKTILLIALVLLVQKLAARFISAQGRFLLWLPVVISLVTPAGFGIPLPANLLPQMRTPALASTDLQVRAAASAPELSATQETRRGNVAIQPLDSLPVQNVTTVAPVMSLPLYSWSSLLSYAWLAGVLVVLGTIAVAGWRFARLVRRAVPAPAQVQNVLEDCRRATRCFASVRVLHSAEVEVPMIAGLFRPVLLLPAGLEHCVTRAQLRHVFIHELMHLQRGDIVSNWIVALVQALHWFNPVVWFAFFRMRQDRELACDAATLRHLAPHDRAAYGHTLLRLNDSLARTPVPAVALGMLHARSHLHQRIHMLAHASTRSAPGSVVTVLAVLPLAALAFSQPAPASRSASVLEENPAVATFATPTTHTTLAAAPQNAVEQAPGIRTVIPFATTATSAAVPTDSPTAVQLAAAAATPIAGTASASEESPGPATPQSPAKPDTAPMQSDAPAQIQRRNAASDTVAASPALQVLAAVSAEQATPAPAPVASYADLPDIEQLSETIAASKAEKIRFIDKGNTTGTECAAREGKFLGALSASCQRIRTAQRRGDIFRFSFECYQLTTIHEELFAHYREVATQQRVPATVENALLANARDLATFCSKDTYASRYPAFAAIIADAETLKYYPPRVSAMGGAMVASSQTRFREVWQQMGVTASNIDPHYTPLWSPGPQPGTFPTSPGFVPGPDGGAVRADTVSPPAAP